MPVQNMEQESAKNCLDANLLREYTTSEGDFVDFEFDSMGDYLKAERLLGRKCDDGDRFRTLVRLYDQMDTAHRARFNRYKKYNFIKAVLSMWNPSAVYWEKQEFMKGKLTSLLLSTM